MRSRNLAWPSRNATSPSCQNLGRTLSKTTGRRGFAFRRFSVVCTGDRAGFHKNHFHARGWLSSAYYVSVPQATRQTNRAGWLKFGQPHALPGAEDAPEFWVKPEAGLLALFPILCVAWNRGIFFGGSKGDCRLRHTVARAHTRPTWLGLIPKSEPRGAATVKHRHPRQTSTYNSAAQKKAAGQSARRWKSRHS